MTSKLVAVNQLRPRIISQETVGLEQAAQRVSKNTTYNVEEIYSILRLYTREMIAALQCGATVKVDGLVSISPNMKVGGEVDLSLRADRGAIAGLNNPQLWTADRVTNHENLSKDSDALVVLWNEKHPEAPVTE
jgi:hypothetical protein